MHQKQIAEIVQKLKIVREEHGLSCQEIVDLVERNGEYVSLSTVKRVFETGSEDYRYQYENTLRPIANAVLGLYSDTTETPTADEADAMKAIIAYKSEKIDELQAQLLRVEESYKRRIDFLTRQITLKDERIDRRDILIERLVNEMLDERKCAHVCPAGVEPIPDLDLFEEEPD